MSGLNHTLRNDSGATGGTLLPITAVLENNDAAQESVPGNIGVWILIAAELTEFALFFLVYLVVRSHNPELFSQGPGRLNMLAGTLNTLALITSSYCVARAMAAIRTNNSSDCLKWLGWTLALAACYCGVKTWEYFWNLEAGLSSRTDLFFTLYYYLTFNHLLHVLMGMCTIGWVAFRTFLGSYNAINHEGLESAACYWHMIDLAWIIIFPLLYVLR
ncbi:cytochrome c oxidase subunit 3 family protein [Motiliproteus sp. MSK22-1]|uniref:cytochrome c oxidase subunit 3 family protein n=1 Tax=Motiliproteus sp. MSK22-1 TaxID=1897630 RepID=UPI0009F936AB|nr:cytochrome c oxidase subunit 3 family protein [Motiliproteus sp. MSK22-1]